MFIKCLLPFGWFGSGLIKVARFTNLTEVVNTGTVWKLWIFQASSLQYEEIIGNRKLNNIFLKDSHSVIFGT